MYENKCAICGQPILGYWYEVGKKNICQSCAASTTVYDLFQRDIVDIKPDIVDGEATLVTKDDEEAEVYVASKSQLNSEYGMAVKGTENSGSSDDMPLPNGCYKECPYYPYITCGHYYGEINECMLEEEKNQEA